MAESLIGTYIGRFKIEEMIGRGGMAEVYKAYQVNLDRHVAIKIMHKFLADDKDFLIRFEREARAMAATKHPNIVDVYDFDVDKDYYYIVMDFLSGGTLKNRIDRVTMEGGVIDIDKAIRIILEVCDALAFAHKRGMIHRDIKPANIMFNEHGSAVLTDFGIARMINRTSNTTTGSMIGTPAYMSPEQGLGESGDNRSDIYSLGVLAYHLLTGQLPHEGDTPLSVVLKHINETPIAPSKINPNLPAEIERVILKALSKNPDHRYETISEMGRELRITAKSNADINSTGEIPIDLLEMEKLSSTNSDSLALPGTENVSRINNLAQTPLPNQFEDAAETKLGTVPDPLQNLFREGISVEDAQQFDPDREMTHFDLPSVNAMETPSKMVNIEPDLPQFSDKDFNEFGMELLPKEYDMHETHLHQPPVDFKEAPTPEPVSRDDMGQQTRNILDTLDFDKQPQLREVVRETQGSQAHEIINRGQPVELLPNTLSEPAPAPQEEEKSWAATGQFVAPEREYETEIEHDGIEEGEFEEFNTEMESFYGGFEDQVSATALEEKEKRVRVKPNNTVLVRRRIKWKRFAGRVLSTVFLILGVLLGYAIYDFAFVEQDGPSLVEQFNTWLNITSGGQIADEVSLEGLIAEQPLGQNGFTQANINNNGIVLVVTDLESIPSNWAAVIEIQTESSDWIPVTNMRTLFNTEGEAVWPLDRPGLEENRLYRWRVYDRVNEDSEIVSSGPFVLPNQGSIHLFEVEAGPPPESAPPALDSE